MCELSVAQLANILLILFTGAVLQSAIGFAAGVFGIPLLLLTGLSLPEAVGISQLHSVAHCSVGVYTLRRSIKFGDTVLPLVIRLAMLPLGLCAMWYAGAIDQNQVKQIVGCILLGILAILWGLRVQPRDSVSTVWTIVAFTVSGFVGGFCGMGGVFMALWVMAHDWSARRSRGFLMFLFLATLLPQAVVMLIVFPKVTGAYQIGLAALPIALAGVWLGLALGNRLPREALRRLMYGVLLLIAVWSIINPFL